jgi:hypothetical protein
LNKRFDHMKIFIK